MARSAFVVFFDPVLEIRSEVVLGLIGVVGASRELDVVHWEAGDEFWLLSGPAFAEASAKAGGGEGS